MRDQEKLLSFACQTYKKGPKKVSDSLIPTLCSKDVPHNIYVTNADSKAAITTKLAEHYNLNIMIIWGNEVLKSEVDGPELFIRLYAADSIRYHTNLGRLIKLPSGVGKFAGPICDLAEMFKMKNFPERPKIRNFSINSDFNSIEREFNVSINIWEKNRLNFSKCNIKRIRDGGDKPRKLHLHFDKLTKKLFMIRDRKLYFRGYLCSLRNDLKE